MTTHRNHDGLASDPGDWNIAPRIDPYWFGRPEQEIRDAVAARGESWAAVPGYARYQWSDKGGIRRAADGLVMKTKVSNSGYELVNVLRDSDGKQVTVTVHSMVLLAHHPAFAGLDKFPPGLESRHNPSTGSLFNAYPEGLWPGTKKENAADKFGEEGPAVQFPCKNAPRCRNLVPREGRRCTDCVAEVGRQAAALLNAGMSLQDAAEVFGYTRGDWTFKLAVRYGGYTGSKEQATAQRLTFVQRARLRVRLSSLLRQASAAPGGDAR